MNNHSQYNTPVTNRKGETRSGKIDRGFYEGHLVENTTGIDTRRGSHLNRKVSK